MAKQAKGWDYWALAERLRQLSLYIAPDEKITALDIVGIEAGGYTTLRRIALLSIVLDFRPHLLQDCWRPPDVDTILAVNGPIGRREFGKAVLLALAAGTVDPSRLVRALSEGSAAVDATLLDQLARYSSRLVEQWDALPPATLHGAMQGHLEVLERLLEGPLPSGLRSRVVALGGQHAAMTGLVARFVGDDGAARVQLGKARQMAKTAGDPATEALAMLWTADTYSGVQRAGDPLIPQTDILAMIDGAVVRALEAPVGAVQAHVWLRQAEELALAGRYVEALRCLERADRVVTLPDADLELGGMGWRWQQLHPAFAGNVALVGGHYQDAVAMLDANLAMLRPEQVSNRCAVYTDLGGAYAHLGEVERSCHLLAAAWGVAQTAGLKDRTGRIMGVRHRDLAPYGEVPAVRLLDEQLAV